MPKEEIINEASKCPCYGCAGVMICTYHSWTTTCTYPKCNKTNLLTGQSVYEYEKRTKGE